MVLVAISSADKVAVVGAPPSPAPGVCAGSSPKLGCGLILARPLPVFRGVFNNASIVAVILSSEEALPLNAKSILTNIPSGIFTLFPSGFIVKSVWNVSFNPANISSSVNPSAFKSLNISLI